MLNLHNSKQLRADLLKRLFFAGQGIAGMRLVKVHDAVFIYITTVRRKASGIETGAVPRRTLCSARRFAVNSSQSSSGAAKLIHEDASDVPVSRRCMHFSPAMSQGILFFR